MTAAFAHEYEYEVPLNGAPPTEAVDRVTEGNVVHLTRGGEPIGRMEPPDPTDAAVARVMRSSIPMERKRELIALLLAQHEEIEDIRAGRTELLLHEIDGESVPWEQVKRDAGL